MFFRSIYHDTGRPNQEQYECFIQRANFKNIVHVLHAIVWFIVIGEDVLTSLKVSYCIFDRYSKGSCGGLEGK